MRHARPLAITLAFAATAASGQAQAATSCDSLLALQLPATHITAVQAVA